MTSQSRSVFPLAGNTTESSGWFASILGSPLLWGGALTVGFYALIPHLPIQRELAERYFCGHPLEYATAALFFVGIAILAFKALGISTEKAALEAGLLGGENVPESREPLARTKQINERIQRLPRRLRATHLTQRVRNALTYIRDRKSSEGLEEHLKYLAELASERLHTSYALVRTITWAVPILGFLGTVIGITMAIANLNFEQYDSSMEAVIGGLAVAFDTTSLALALSLLLVFCSFLVERSEQEILVRVEDYGLSRLPLLFPASTKQTDGPFAAAQTEAATQLMERTEALITRQTEMWQQSIESIRGRWATTLESQQQYLDEALKQGMSETLNSHTGQLAEVRGEFLDAFREVSAQLREQMNVSQQGQQELQRSIGNQLSELWQQAHGEMIEVRDEGRTHANTMIETISSRIADWQSQLKQNSDAGIEQLEELRKQREVLLKVIEDEQELARLQTRLTENIEAVRGAEAFEETLHSLSAAVHLLTARTKPKAA